MTDADFAQYLPRETCDAIAEHLPVTYSSDYNLYLWDTDDETFEQIVTSPHYMWFTFSSETDQTPHTINIPFALLNLTLEWPLVSNPTPYFPCSPHDADGPSAHLGRSFLQAAFLAKNYNTSLMYLAQAPGPDVFEPIVQPISADDTSISPATNLPDWASTWSSTLKALPGGTGGNDNGDGSRENDNDGSQESDSNGLSGGAIAGIVIGVVAGVVLVAGLIFWLVRRKKKTGTPEAQQEGPKDVHAHWGQPGSMGGPPHYSQVASDEPAQKPMQQVYEAEATSPLPAEMDVRQEPSELPAENPKENVK